MGIRLKTNLSLRGKKTNWQLPVLGQGQPWALGDPGQQLFCIWVGGQGRIHEETAKPRGDPRVIIIIIMAVIR